MQQNNSFNVKRVHKVNLIVLISLVCLICLQVLLSDGIKEAIIPLIAGSVVIIISVANISHRSKTL